METNQNCITWGSKIFIYLLEVSSLDLITQPITAAQQQRSHQPHWRFFSPPQTKIDLFNLFLSKCQMSEEDHPQPWTFPQCSDTLGMNICDSLPGHQNILKPKPLKNAAGLPPPAGDAALCNTYTT